MKIRFLLIFLLFSLSIRSTAQLTPAYTEPLAELRMAHRLFEEQRYSDARMHFSNIVDRLSQINDKQYALLIEEANYYKALCGEKTGINDGEAIYKNIIDNYEKNSITHLAYWRLACIEFNKRRFDKALALLVDIDETVLSDNDIQDYNYKLGYCYFTKKLYDQADKYLRKATNINNDIGNDASYYAGYVAYDKREYNDALHFFSQVRNSPRYATTTPYFMANIFYVKKNYDKVIELAEPLANSNSDYRQEIRLLLGKAYYNTKDYSRAQPLLKEYIDNKGSGGVEELYQLGVCEYYAKNYSLAIGYLQNVVLGDDSLTQNAYALLANCYMKTNDKQKARSSYAEAAKTDFDKKVKMNAAFNYAQLSAELGYQDVSAKALDAFLRQYPHSEYETHARELLIDLLLRGNNFKEALKVIANVKELTPAMRKAYQRVAYGRAIELMNANDNTGADDMFNTSLKNPINILWVTGSYFYKAQVHFNLKDYNVALTDLDKYSVYAKRLKRIPDELSTAKAEYTYGYIYIKLKEYSTAEQAFKKSRALCHGNSDEKMKLDGILRAGDCAFVLRHYDMALEYYGDISDLLNEAAGSDYATFQSAIILGLQKKDDDKISTLKTLLTSYKTSDYRDDALYECGVTYLNMGLYAQSLDYFNDVISNYLNSPYIRTCYLKRGLVYANLGDEAKSREQYEYVAKNYSKSSEAKEALAALQDLYVSKGNATSYIEFLKTIPDAPVSSSQQDSIIYLAAETEFIKNDYEKAIWDLTDYLQKYPTGTFALQAHFYKAECLRNTKKNTEALPDYEWIINAGQSRFSSKALLQAARISLYDTKDYNKAYGYYKQLNDNADTKSSHLEASQGMMYASNSLKNNTNTASAAEEVIGTQQATKEDILEAKYYAGMSYFRNNNSEKAIPYLYNIYTKLHDEKAAEAGYTIALIKFNQGGYKESQTICFEIIDKLSSYDIWVTKSYLLLGDCYHKLGDNFQAKATYKSLIDNSDDNDVLKEAKSKYDALQQEDLKNATLLQKDSTTAPIDSLKH